MSDHTHLYICTHCYAERVPPARWAKGYKTCLSCGDKLAKATVRTVVPLHKSSYVLITDPTLLVGINNKGPR